MKVYYFLFLLIFVQSVACSDNTDSDPGLEVADIKKTVTINVGQTYQTIEGFAASDCWSGNYVGAKWSLDQKESIARLLFSRTITNGQPEGIGLSMWRFNLGAGSAEQGDDSGIEDKSRRAESFLNADGSYDWNKQAGQQYFLQKAKDYGCESFVMFSNSPPVNFTNNGKAFSASGSVSNLRTECYDDFADYMTTVAKYFKEQKGINFSLISPVNEPQYNWTGGQEGSGWQNSEIKRLVVELDKSLTKKNLDCGILVTEAASWEYLYKVKDDSNRSNQIEDLFTVGKKNYIGDLDHVDNIIGGHSYWIDGNWNTLLDTRTILDAAAKAKGLKLYQTEWSMLGDQHSDTDYPGHEKATPMQIALYMSKVMHHDLATASVSSWSFWTSMDVARWNHKNRFLLINLIPSDGAYGDIEGSGTHEDTKSLWVLGNYSLFVKPGYQRVDLSIENSSKQFFGSAYKSTDGKTLVAVFTNTTNKSIGVDLSVANGGKIKSYAQYTTSATQNLELKQSSSGVIIDPSSVATIVYELN
jgi:O-glycosyl hydrolase